MLKGSEKSRGAEMMQGQSSCWWTAGTWVATQLQAPLLPLSCDRLVAALRGLGSPPTHRVGCRAEMSSHVGRCFEQCTTPGHTQVQFPAGCGPGLYKEWPTRSRLGRPVSQCPSAPAFFSVHSRGQPWSRPQPSALGGLFLPCPSSVRFCKSQGPSPSS